MTPIGPIPDHYPKGIYPRDFEAPNRDQIPLWGRMYTEGKGYEYLLGGIAINPDTRPTWEEPGKAYPVLRSQEYVWLGVQSPSA